MSLLRPFAAVVFDMDGTLLDTEMVYKDVIWDVSAGMGITMREDIHVQMVGISNEESSQLMRDSFGADSRLRRSTPNAGG